MLSNNDKQDKDIREADGLLWFLYSCDRANGGGALCQSYHKKRPIRVFRSSLAGKPYGPPFLDVEDDLEDDSDVAYRYDGLYIVRAVWDMNGRETEAHPVIGENGWQTYFCTRVSKRPLEKEKREEGMHYNVIGCQELWSSIQSMRGVRRLKKFEIEIPPTKLSMIKKCAITGIYKDRKCPGYVKPIVEIPMETSTTTNAAKKPSRIKGGRKRRQQQEEEESDSDDEESKNEENVSDSDSSEEVSSPVSKRSSSLSKTTPRPRMNSHKKSSPSSTHDDSSDSETSTSANITQKKKRVRSPSRKALLNNMDVSAYFPKRASAAKAEKANRDIVGSRTYKRKSSETTSATAASSKANKQPIRAGGGGRKRAKANKRDEDEFSTSSEEGPDNSNMIDQSILTVGSRILVAYKDSLFKSTIRKRREKAGKHDFLIHYDGNKKTNVHWITVDKIQKILEINVDTPPKKKVATTKSRGNNGGGKRKAPSKQNSSASQESGSSSNTRPSLVRQQSLQQSHYQDKDGGSEDETDNDKKKSPRKKSKTEVAEPKVDVDDGDKSDEKKSATASSDKKKSASKDPHRKTSKTQKSKNSADRIVEESSSSESEPDDPPPPTPKRKSNIKITTAADAVSRKPRKTVVSDVCIAQKHKPLAKTETASDDEADSDKSSTSSSEEESVESEPEEDFKYPVGSQVYTEYRRVFYSSTILKAKQKRSLTEYLVHYEGYKKSSNRWVKEKDLHEVNDATTRRYEEQRVAPTADSPHESDWVQESSMTTRRKKPVECDLDNSGRSSTTTRKKPPPRRIRSDQYDAALDALESGVAFLVGSMVFVEWSGALYLAKMLKKRYSGDRTEYMISYDGYRSSNDAWVSINKIYEVNPQTKRVFKLINTGTSGSSASNNKPKAIPKRRETRKKAHDDEAAAATSSTRNSERKQPTLSRATSTASSQSSRATSTIDMKGIEPGVEFLPGSTIFAEYKGGLCLAKMLKKRGKNDYMEYFIEYSGLKKALEVWISTSMVYEINPQTKRMFRQLQVKK